VACEAAPFCLWVMPPLWTPWLASAFSGCSVVGGCCLWGGFFGTFLRNESPAVMGGRFEVRSCRLPLVAAPGFAGLVEGSEVFLFCAGAAQALWVFVVVVSSSPLCSMAACGSRRASVVGPRLRRIGICSGSDVRSPVPWDVAVLGLVLSSLWWVWTSLCFTGHPSFAPPSSSFRCCQTGFLGVVICIGSVVWSPVCFTVGRGGAWTSVWRPRVTPKEVLCLCIVLEFHKH